MLVLFFTFIVCYVPVSFVKIFKKENAFPYLNVFGYLGVFFSSIINPVIYAAFSEEYKAAYKDLFCYRRTDI
ncbi:G-protein coupled receptor moody, partial [Stegodyphus mimosarum]